MRKLILTRLAAMPIVLIASTVVTFILMHLSPISPVAAILGPEASASQRAAYAHKLGLDDPFVEQYLQWLMDAFRGDLGVSYFMARPVVEIIGGRYEVTLSMAAAGIVVTIGLGLTLGLLAASKPGSLLDRCVGSIIGLSIALPNFWIGIILALVFAVQLGWLPAVGYTRFADDPLGWIRCLILPGLALGAHGAAVVARQTREAMIDALGSSQYVVSLRSRGLSERRVRGYAFKNALLPIIAVIGVEMPVVIGGTLIVESIFGSAGLGSMLILGVLKGDAPVLIGGVLIVVMFSLILNMLVDIAYGMVDPRVRPS